MGKDPKIAVLIPAYQRPEYTALCMESIENAQEYKNTVFYLLDDGGNCDVFEQYKRKEDILVCRKHPLGLRNAIIEFIEWVRTKPSIEYISKVDNDCVVPNHWLDDLIDILKTTDAQIISPNVSETQAAFKYGLDDTYELGFRPSSFVGGLWTMQRKLIDTPFFEKADTTGIRGAFSLLHQIIVMNDPKPIIGWTDKVTFQDIGHWGGTHPHHIKSEAHERYSAEIGRPVGWTVEAGK